MNLEQFDALVTFDEALAVGQRVQARWTDSGKCFRETGTVTKLNKSTVRVKLDCAPGCSGRTVTVRRFGESLNAMKRWSNNNGVFPLSEV